MAPMASLDVKQTIGSANQVQGAAYPNDFLNESSEKALGMISQTAGYGFYTEAFGREYSGMSEAAADGGMFDHMALSDHFLGQYYTQVKMSKFLTLKTIFRTLLFNLITKLKNLTQKKKMPT